MFNLNKNTEPTLVALKNLHAYLSKGLTTSTQEELEAKASNAMTYITDVETMVPKDEVKVKTYQELERRIDVKSHMDDEPMITTIREEVEIMIEEITPNPDEKYLFTMRFSDRVWTCEYLAVTKHQIAVITWSNNNVVGYEQEDLLPKGRLIEAETENLERSVVGAEIDGKVYEVVNPKHILSYSAH
ncbi:TPA: hypothetical protein P0E36_004892 [Vibrio harveyi]|nr:hypothetical protein [Vibrio harveyi]